MTQSYIAGEFSLLLGDLQPAPPVCAAAVGELRREVESSPLRLLPGLAREALSLTDTICWAALDEGNASAFLRYSRTAATLREFVQNAGLAW